MPLGADATALPVAPDAAPSPAPSVDALRHWRVLPELDHRHGVAARDRGVLHLGHTRLLPCLGCAAPRSTPAERPTVPVRGDRALPPTLRPLPPPSERVAPRRAASRPSHHRTPPPPPMPLNARQRILVALASLGEGPVTLAALAVRAWQLCPTAFGLRGFEGTHPDSNRVWAKLSGTDGLGALGWCTRPAPAQVEITAKGRRVATALAKAGAR